MYVYLCTIYVKGIFHYCLFINEMTKGIVIISGTVGLGLGQSTRRPECQVRRATIYTFKYSIYVTYIYCTSTIGIYVLTVWEAIREDDSR